MIGEGGDHVIVGESLLEGGPPLPEPPRFPLEATPEQELRVAAMSETASVSRANGHESLVRMAISLGKQKFNVAWMFHREEWLPWLITECKSEYAPALKSWELPRKSIRSVRGVLCLCEDWGFC